MDEQKFIIAEGVNKESTTWVNKVYSEEEFIDKFRCCRVTNIKNGPGFVGGSLYRNNYNRYKTNIKDRILITLDLDNIKDKEEADDIVNNIHYRGIVYSTFNHTEGAPRLRIVLFLDKAIEARKYEAVARRVANMIYSDKSVYDQSTFQLERLMYYPMSSNVNNYFFKELKGECIDPDIIMDFYEPLEANNKINNSDKKQDNPLNKDGIIGAFCRTYNIHEVIEKYLYDYYEQSSIETKYKRIGSKDGPGAIVYNSDEFDYAVFMYSHHGSDPICNRLCNAWDLVRLHKFSDVDYEKDKSKNKLEYEKWSSNKMTDLAMNDKDVYKLFTIESVKGDFESVDISEYDFIDSLDKTKAGKIKPTISNILIILQNDPNLKDRVKYNEFSNTIDIIGELPWTRSSKEWDDVDDAGLRAYLELYGIESKQKIDDALRLNINKNKYNPARDYFNSLDHWDGEYRIERLLIDYLGAEDNEWSKLAIKKWLVAAVKRIFEPGCKFDEMLVLTGMQGLGKGTFFRLLTPNENWYTDRKLDIDKDRELIEVTSGRMIVEIGELGSYSKKDMESIKSFQSKQEIVGRCAYDRRVTKLPIQYVLAGSTNESEFLKDYTGERRFWVVDVGTSINKSCEDEFMYKERIQNKIRSEIPECKNQIWAEAFYLYKSNYPIYLDAQGAKLSSINAENHKVENSLIGMIEAFLDSEIVADGDFGESSKKMKRDKVCALEIWNQCLGNIGRPRRIDTIEINSALSQIPGWRKADKTLHFGGVYGKQKGFVRINKSC